MKHLRLACSTLRTQPTDASLMRGRIFAPASARWAGRFQRPAALERAMAEPTTYRGWQEFYHRAGHGKPPGRKAQAAILKRAAQRCIKWLYDPTPDDIGWQARPRIKDYGMDQAAINWGDLRVVEA